MAKSTGESILKDSLYATRETRDRGSLCLVWSMRVPSSDILSSRALADQSVMREPNLETFRGAAATSGLRKEAAMAVAALATAVAFLLREQAAHPTASRGSEQESSSYLLGLGFSGLALVGSTAVGALRKVVSAKGVGSAEQVGIACLVQGVVALVICVRAGEIGAAPLPGRFWWSAAGASSLLVLVKTLETRAYAESDISLCAPFLAFDPVMQLLVGVVAMPFLCPLIGLGCDEPEKPYPLHHLLSLICVVLGAFSLSTGAAAAVGSARGGKAQRSVGGLAVGSWYILFNCVLYGFTSRMDKVAISSSSKTVYYAWGRLIMAGTALGGTAAAGGSLARLRKLVQPSVILLILLTCGADALYQLSQYQAMARISPVYVTAIKRGGGILLSSMIGTALFSESLEGRLLPILAIVVGVVFLCL